MTIFRRRRTKRCVTYLRGAPRRSLPVRSKFLGIVPKESEAMPSNTQSTLTDALRSTAHLLTDSARDYDPLFDLIGEARVVLLGEASHGTHDFYHHRAQITERLIKEKGFTGVAVEADWPDAYRVNRYVRDASDDAFAVEALSDFKRFPTWMWRNTDVVEFLEWVHEHNEALPPRSTKIGFYGLD